MSKLNTLLLIGLILVAQIGCTLVKSGKASNKNKVYTEDLSAYSPKVLAPVSEPNTTEMEEILLDSTTAPVNNKLNTALDTAASFARANIKYIDGFTIQIYGGDNRTLAKDYKLKLLRNFPASEPIMVFEQPNYKVRIGEYYTRLEAQEFFKEIKEVFPRGILIPKRIKIN